MGALPLQEIQERPLADIPSLVRDKVPTPAESGGETHDVFISHASEDKDELDGIVTRTVSVLLPIWHNITKQQLVDFSPSLVDKVARSTATHTIDEIAAEIAGLLQARDITQQKDERITLWAVGSLLIAKILNNNVD